MENMDKEQDISRIGELQISQTKEGTENEAASGLPIEFMRAQNLFEQHIFRTLKSLCDSFKQLENKVASLGETVRGQGREFGLCFAALRKCQRQTAEFAGNNFERHVIWPAIKIMVKLADELQQLDIRVQQLNTADSNSSNIETLRKEIQISVSIAAEQLAYFDIERIVPVKMGAIDPQQHCVAGFIETDDKSLHGKINDLIKPGIKHRGRVIEPAIVSVFRYVRLNEDRNEK